MFAKNIFLDQRSNQTQNSQDSHKQSLNIHQEIEISMIKEEKIGDEFEPKESFSKTKRTTEQDDFSDQQNTQIMLYSENQLLFQHQYCLDHQMKKIFSQYFQIKLTTYHKDHYQSFQIPQFQTVQQFIDSTPTILQLFSGQKLIDYIEKRPQIAEFLQWLYDSCPMLIVKDLILAACRILFIYSHYQTCQMSKHQLHELAQNVLFINHIYNCPYFQLLRVQISPLFFNGYTTNCPSNLLSFILSFTLTILLVADGQETNPSFDNIVKITQEIQKQETNRTSVLTNNFRIEL